METIAKVPQETKLIGDTSMSIYVFMSMSISTSISINLSIYTRIYIYDYIYNEIYYKKLSHVII